MVLDGDDYFLSNSAVSDTVLAMERTGSIHMAPRTKSSVT